MARDNREIVGRINAALKESGHSARAASLEAGLGADAIRDLARKPKTFPTIDTLEKLAPVLGRSPDYLAFGKRPTRSGRDIPAMKVIGEVAAGLWLDLNAFEEREYEQFPIPFHPGYALDAQYGLIVIGTSINRVAQPGDVLQCLDCGISGLEPQDNDVVIVERRRAQAGQKEVTAKRYMRTGRTIELRPDSTDRRWSEPLIFDPRQASDGEELAIVAVVIGIYKPMRRR